MSVSKHGMAEDRYIYNTLHPQRGKAVIFNIRDFNMRGGSPDVTTRQCTDIDVATIYGQLSKLGFSVDLVQNDPDKKTSRLVSLKTVLEKIESGKQFVDIIF